MGDVTARGNGSTPQVQTGNGSVGNRGRLVILAATEVGLYHFEGDETRGGVAVAESVPGSLRHIPRDLRLPRWGDLGGGQRRAVLGLPQRGSW